MEYSIGEFSKLTGLGIHTLRYYEQEGLIAPERNSSNRRCYSDKDLTWIEFIKTSERHGNAYQGNQALCRTPGRR